MGMFSFFIFKSYTIKKSVYRFIIKSEDIYSKQTQLPAYETKLLNPLF